MPDFNYSPWTDAGNSFSHVGHSVGSAAYRIALMRQQAQQRGRLDAMHAALMQAEADNYGSKTSHQEAVDNAAKQFSGEMGQYVAGNENYDNPPQYMPTPQGQEVPNQGPMQPPMKPSRSRLAAAAALAAALGGDPQKVMIMHNIPANNVAINPMTGEREMGGTLLTSGSEYVPPGSDQPIVNPRPFFAPAGSTPMDETGVPTGPQTNFRPDVKRPYFAPAGSTPMDAQGQPVGPQTGFRPGTGGSAQDRERRDMVAMFNQAVRALSGRTRLDPNIEGMMQNLTTNIPPTVFPQGFRPKADVTSGTKSNAFPVPKMGEVQKGYRYIGGDPSKKESWEKVAGGGQ